MAQGIEIFTAGGVLLLSSAKQVALYTGSAYVEAGSNANLTLPALGGSVGASVWPDNGHIVSSIIAPDENGNPYMITVLGPWKHATSINGNVLSMTYPSMRAEYVPTGYVFNYAATQMETFSGANVDYWGN